MVASLRSALLGYLNSKLALILNLSLRYWNIFLYFPIYFEVMIEPSYSNTDTIHKTNRTTALYCVLRLRYSDLKYLQEQYKRKDNLVFKTPILSLTKFHDIFLASLAHSSKRPTKYTYTATTFPYTHTDVRKPLFLAILVFSYLVQLIILTSLRGPRLI